MLFAPPGTAAYSLVAWLPLPPLTVDQLPLAVLPKPRSGLPPPPPPTVASWPLAVLSWPPLTVELAPLAVLPWPPPTVAAIAVPPPLAVLPEPATKSAFESLWKFVAVTVPEKVGLAGKIEFEIVPLVRCDALRLLKPPPLPVNVPTITLFVLVAITTPAKPFDPPNAFVPFSRAMLVESWESATFPVTLLAVVAVAAFPLILIAAVPALRLAGFRPVREAPLPANNPAVIVPENVMLEGRLLLAIVPVICAAGNGPVNS